MRKIGLVAAAAAAALVLTGCGGDEETEPEQASAEESDERADDGDGNDEAGDRDLSEGLLTAEDLPEGSEVTPFDVGEVASGIGGLADMLQDVSYEPAECASNDGDPLSADGVDAAGITAQVGAGAEIEIVVNAVYIGADADDLSGLSDYVQNCGAVTINGSIADQAVDVSVHSELVDAPSVDADAVVAMETSSNSQDMPSEGAPTRIIYMVDGDLGVYVAGNPNATDFDMDELAQAALERARSLDG